jgi:serine/threonine protein kinase
MFTLKDWFSAETVVLTLMRRDGYLTAIKSSLDLSHIKVLTPHIKLPSSLAGKVPTLDPSAILLPADLGPTRPTKVTFESDTYFFKAAYNRPHAVREIDTLLRLQAPDLIQVVDAPTLRGLILCAEDNNMICGYLLDYIEYRDILISIDIQKESMSVRSGWIRQISEIIGAFHDAGIAWGDAKPDNILVDTNDNLRIIDFGGGYSSGWVDEDKVGTFEGDDQALSRIVHFLATGEHLM